ncbi:hypothetical protein FW774_01730 (plasmid) [Pedobacter sp. BS3]|uniref:hypothetical protein n=1 Tax=Pedobacter sp. BS3 TaxID=2567937 RepID=UPI0011ECC525|nr:hypothetical protein [Pedobacter sp. BS3]TZF85817.1 hypothetical protein FW774_01730 [Pedobacter sp. BS3]
MKKIVFITLTIFMSRSLFAQDKIITHVGDTINCKVIEVLDNSIKYRYPDEDIVSSINKTQVEKINFASGRSQQITEKIVVNGEEDWQKVIITNVADDVKGLKRKGEVYGKALGGWGAASNAKKVYMKAEERLKKEAAKLGAHIIYAKDLVVKNGEITSGQWARSMLSGVAYGYK